MEACRLARFLKGYLALGLLGPDGYDAMAEAKATVEESSGTRWGLALPHPTPSSAPPPAGVTDAGSSAPQAEEALATISDVV